MEHHRRRRCSGARLERCACGAGRGAARGAVAAYRCALPLPGDVLLAPTKRAAGRAPHRHNLLYNIVTRLYDKCAGYNLRYCPFRGVSGNENYLSGTLRDLFILLCFFLANSVVFLMIFTRMLVQLSYIAVDSAKWLRKFVQTKTTAPAHTQIVTMAPHPYQVGLPVKRKYSM